MIINAQEMVLEQKFQFKPHLEFHKEEEYHILKAKQLFLDPFINEEFYPILNEEFYLERQTIYILKLRIHFHSTQRHIP